MDIDDTTTDTFIPETFTTELLWVVQCREHRSQPMGLGDAIRLQARWEHGIELSRGWAGKCKRKHMIKRIWKRTYQDGGVYWSWDERIFPLAPAVQNREFKFGWLDTKETPRQRKRRLLMEIGKRGGDSE